MPLHHRDPVLPSSAAAFALVGDPHYAPDLPILPIHMDLALRLDLVGCRLDAVVTITVTAITAGARALCLDAMALEIESVESALSVHWHADGATLQIEWVTPFISGEQRDVVIRYAVTRPITGLLFSAMDPSRPAEVHWAATDHETERARYWLPCVDHPSVRPSWSLHIRAPQRYTARAGGQRTGVDVHDDGTQTTHWELSHPCPSYLLCLLVGDLVSADGGASNGVPITFFAPPPCTPEVLLRSFGPTWQMMDWLVGRLGVAFPFPKYDQFAVHQIGGAMENISLVSWDDLALLDARAHAEFGWLVDIINLHEMAHSYFGDAVVVRDFAHVWLKESWATYMESVWYEETQGRDAMHLQLYEERVAYLSEADERYQRPIITRRYDSTWDMFDRHLYPGGAIRLHMLRKHLGDEVFWVGVQRFLSRHMGQAVETADFRRALEEVSGRYLARYFEQWFESPGYPKLKASFAYEDGVAKVTVEQTQVNPTKGIGLFDLPLEVAFADADGAWTRHSLQLSQARHTLSVALPARPLQVVLDPDMNLVFALEFDPGADLLRRALTAPFIQARLQATETLAKSGRAADMAAILDAWRLEERWGVRMAMARLLGKANTQVAADALAAMIQEEHDPQAMLGIMDAASNYRDPGIAAALRAWLTLPERPYRAAGAALRALGLQRHAADFKILQVWAEDEGWWGHARRGAMTGLGALRTKEATQLLQAYAAMNKLPTQVRTMAIEALSDAARWQERAVQEQVGEQLVDLLRDPVYNVRMAAARALAALGMPERAGALESLTATIATQDHARVRRMAAGLRHQTPDALQKQVETLTDKLRQALGRIDALESKAKGA